MDVDKLIEKICQVFPFKTSRQNEANRERLVKSYDEHLHAGNVALQDGDLKAAEQHFASALKQIHERQSPQLREEEACLRKLGTVYVRRGTRTKNGRDFAKATALFNAALARGGNKHVLVDAIKKAERLFLYHTVGVDHEPSPYDTDIEHKNRLEKYRTKLKARLQKIHNDHNPYTYDDDDPKVKEVEMKRANSVKDLFKDISKQRKDFIKDLVQECIKTIGPPPCQYAMVGLGSQATELVTPYSDLEFAILIEENKDTSDNKEYFLNLTLYLYLKIINLGETILPAVAIRSLNDFCSRQTAEKTTEYPTEDRYPTEGPKESPTEGPKEDRTEDSTASPAEGGAEDSAKKLTKGLSKVPTEDPVEVPTEENSNEDPAKDSSDNTTEDRTENPKEGEADDHAGSWFYDSVTPRGFAFDGAMPWASKTPLGREKTRSKKAVSLVQTPAGMAEFQRHDIALAHGYHLASILRHVSFLTGNQALVDDYMARVIQGLNTFDDSLGRTTVADSFARRSLSQIIEENLDQELTDRPLDVKKEIYRFPTVAVVNLGLLNGVYAASVWDVIQEMEKAAVVTKENAHHLQVLVSISGELRLRTYLELGGQKENLSGLLAMRTHAKDREETFLKSVFHVPDQKMLFRYYYTARPLRKYVIGIKSANRTQPEAETFYDASSSVKADICRGILQFNATLAHIEDSLRELDEGKDAETSLRGQTQKRRSKAHLLGHRGMVYSRLGDNRNAISCWEEQLRLQQQLYGHDSRQISSTKLNLVRAWREVGGFEMSRTYSTDCFASFAGDRGTEIATALSSWKDDNAPNIVEDYFMLGEKMLHVIKTTCGEISAHPSLKTLAELEYKYGYYTKAITHTEESLKIMRTMYGEDTAHPDIAESLLILGHSLCVSQNDHVKAARYKEKALEMNKLVYGCDTPHPVTADILRKLGEEWIHLVDHPKATSYFVQSLKMYQELYGQTTPHHDTALALNNLGAVSADNFKAINFFEDALNMLEMVHSDKKEHPDIALVLRNLGAVCCNIKEYQKSLQYYERELKINIGMHGQDAMHPSTAESLCSLGVVYRHLEDYTKALQFFKDALNMKKFIHGGDEACHPDIAEDLRNLGGLLGNVGDNEKARVISEQALKMYQKLYGPTTPHHDTALALNTMGVVFAKSGDNFKATNFLKDALNMLKTVLGDKQHPDIAMVLGNLGSACYEAGEHQKCLQYYERALEIYKGIHGQDVARPSISISLRLVEVYKEFGDYTKAIQLYEEALNMTKIIHGAMKAHGGDKACLPDIADILNNLGCLWYGVGDTEKASAFWEQALKMYQELYGPTTPHHDTAMVLTNMGIACHKAGENQKSLQYCERAVETIEGLDREDSGNPDIARYLRQLATVYENHGNYTKAAQLHEGALKMTKNIHGADRTHGGEEARHPDIANVLNDLGRLWFNVGDIEKARAFWEQALKMYQELYGPTTPHHDTAMVLRNMGVACHKARENQKSLQYYNDALNMLKAIHIANETHGGEKARHPDIADILTSLGCLWYNVGDNAKALSLFEQALKMYQELHGPTAPHHDTAMALANMGEVLEKSGNHFKAISFYEEALKMKEEVLGSTKENPDIASWLGYLGSAYHKAGDHTKSLQYRERALEMIGSIHGKDAVHRNIAEALSKIAAVYEDLEDYTKAIQLYEDALVMVKTICDANKTHPDILKLLNNLETACNKAGDQEKANGYHEQAQALKAAVEGQGHADNDIKQPLGE
ncbi:uncharacterized protein LOC144877668 [Branchiostoma floridae x Branchiostoma japonicum]